MAGRAFVCGLEVLMLYNFPCPSFSSSSSLLFLRERKGKQRGYIPVHLFVHCITNKDLSVLHAQCYNNCTLPGACHVVANCGAYL